MGGQNLLFGFDDLSAKDKAVKSIQRQFARLGASVVSVDIPTTIKRKARKTYREVNLTFTDFETGTPRAASSSGTDRSPARFATRLSRRRGASET